MSQCQFVRVSDIHMLVAHQMHECSEQFGHTVSVKVHSLLTNTENILASRSRDLCDDTEIFNCVSDQSRCADNLLHLHHGDNVSDHHTQVNHVYKYLHRSSCKSPSKLVIIGAFATDISHRDKCLDSANSNIGWSITDHMGRKLLVLS